jgi:valyl-tRNA synthetase
VVEELTGLGLLLKTEDYVHNVGYSQRSHVPIEPRLSEQWFLKYPCVQQARASVEQVGERETEPDAAAQPGGLENSASAGQMRFHPQRWAKVYDHWLGNIQDWCISRQLWWGHRIPVWYRKSKVQSPKSKAEGSEPKVQSPESKAGDGDVWCDVEPPADLENWEQDPDVLDTWFSSWLWPFATMGWTGDKSLDAKNPTLRKFYPTTDLVTAPDIIFFWVARMIMAGYEFMGDLPFRNVYFTGIIRDKQGRKMSKTLGNSPDPLELISQYGADALRFGTMRSAPLGQDVLFDVKDVELGRNFCNKLWNACRFRQMQSSGAGASAPVQGEIDPQLLASDDKWILLKLDRAIREITAAFAEYKFNEATATLYRFFWSEYCDWYVEASKAALRPVESLKRETAPTADQPSASPLGGERAGMRGEAAAARSTSPSPLGGERAGVRGEERVSCAATSPPLPPAARGGEGDARRLNALAVIDFVLSHTLRLFHPFLPFITEELWQGMGYAEDMPEDQGGKTIMFAPWPRPFDDDFKAHYRLTADDEQFVEARNELVVQGRNLRRTGNIPASKKVKYIFKPAQRLDRHDVEVMRLLLNAETLEVNPTYEPAKGTPAVRASLGELCLPLEGQGDPAAEKARLMKELEKIETEIAKAEQKLANPNFVQKAPPAVLAEHKKRLAEWQAKREHVKKALEAL